MRDALVQLGHASEIVALDLDFTPLERLARRQPQAVFNLVEAVRGDATLAPMAPAVLEHLGLPCTGSGLLAQLRTMSKLLTKQAMTAHGLPTAPWWTAPEAVPAGERVIVKSVWEHASYGMDAASVVAGRAAAGEISSRQARFGGEFFAERFLEGREFNVAILEGEHGPEVLPIQEIVFEIPADQRPQIVDYEAKWTETSPAYHGTPRRFGLEAREPQLAGHLAQLGLACWQEFGLAGYARVDLRTDATGQPFVLEVNTNPCLTPDAGFAATAAEAGLSYTAIIARILAAAGCRTRTEAPCCA